MTKLRKWSDLGRILGYGGIPGLSTQIKGAYMRIVKPYEDFCARVRTSPSMSPGQDPLKASTSNPIPLGSTSRTPDESGYGSGLSSPLTESSSPLSEPPDDGEEGNASGSKPRRSTRMPSQEQTTRTYAANHITLCLMPVFSSIAKANFVERKRPPSITFHRLTRAH